MSMLQKLSSLAVLLIAVLSLQVHALDFAVDSVNCTQLDWTATLTQSEWSVASYVELFFVSTQGARNYSLLYSAMSTGDFPTPGTFNKVTNFGSTELYGGYRIGIGLADVNGNILTTTNTNQGIVQVTAVDPRTLTFGDCSASTGAAATTSSSVASTSVASSMFASASPSSAISAPTVSSRPVGSSTVPAAAASTSASAAPVGSLSSTSASAITSSHHANKGAIAGGVIGGLLLLLVAFALARWYSSRHRTRKVSSTVHRMASIRSITPSEKQGGSPKTDGSEAPDSVHRKTAQSFASGDTLEAAALGRLSTSSQRRSEGHTPLTVALGERLSLSEVLRDGPAEQGEQEIRVVHVPFQLAPGQQVAPAQESTAFSPSEPYLPLTRTTSNPLSSPSSEYFHPAASSIADDHIPAYPGQTSLHSRSRSTPLAIDVTSTDGTPTTSPTGSTFQNRSINATYKIPRVTVPAYLGQELEGPSLELGEPFSRQISRSSSMRRASTGAATVISVDEDPFVDAAQEQLV